MEFTPGKRIMAAPGDAVLSFEVGFHRGCKNVKIVPNDAAGIPWVYCEDCRCLSHLELSGDNPRTWEAQLTPVQVAARRTSEVK